MAFQQERNPQSLVVHPQERENSTQVIRFIKRRQHIEKNLATIFRLAMKTATEFMETRIIDANVSRFIPSSQKGLQHGNKKGTRVVGDKSLRHCPKHIYRALLHRTFAKQIAGSAETRIGERAEIVNNQQRIASSYKALQLGINVFGIMSLGNQGGNRNE